MTATLSSHSSPTISPQPPSSSSPNSNASLPALMTGNPTRKSIQMANRQSSLAKDRMSTYSMASATSQKISRPASSIIPVLRSSLPYTQVRDFAYPVNITLHYGPPPISSATPSGQSTPAFDSQFRSNEIPNADSDPARTGWTAGGWGGSGTEQLPQVAYSSSHLDDHGPPYSEDEDLQSPVVVTSKHRRWPPGPDDRSDDDEDGDEDSPDFKERGYFTGINGDGSETYYVSQADEMADGPGGELVTYPPDHANHSASVLYPSSFQKQPGGPDGHRRLEPGHLVDEESRFSRDYQFTIASPDEEMHGKAVALFDFARENENELPLIEGQVIWVSYRHGQGWLVAEDPKTRESGLVPEEYVRLLRDIEGGWTSLSSGGTPTTAAPLSGITDATSTKQVSSSLAAENTAANPTTKTVTALNTVSASTNPTPSSSPTQHRPHSSSGSNGERHPPVVSTFSTSSKDLDHYPHPLLGTQTGQQPPQVVHYGSSQSNTPTILSPSVARNPSFSEGKAGKIVKRSVSRQKKENKKK